MNAIDSLILEPVCSYMSSGNNIQICKTEYKGIEISWQTIFWWNIFRDPSDTITVCLCLPDTTILENGFMQQYYEPEGFAAPCFRTLEFAVEFIDNYLIHKS